MHEYIPQASNWAPDVARFALQFFSLVKQLFTMLLSIHISAMSIVLLCGEKDQVFIPVILDKQESNKG